MYLQVGLEDDDSQRITKSRVFKVGAVLAGGCCLALLSTIAMSTVSTSNVAEPTTLLASPSSFRASMKSKPMVPSLSSLPGPTHLKKLALEGIAASNRCDRGASVKAFWKNMDPASKDVVVKAAAGSIETMQDLKAGQIAPAGFFDPLGLSANLEEGKILFYREAELKHGRVCMLASLGFIVGENFHPLFGGDIDVPSLVAFQATPLQVFWPLVLAAIAIPESQFSVPAFKEPVTEEGSYSEANSFAVKSDRIPGDIGFDPLDLKPSDPAELLELQNKELANGRLAMLATAGMVAQELVDGQKIIDHLQR